MFSHPLRRLALLVLGAALLSSVGCARKDENPNALRWGADEEGGEPYISKDPATGKYVGFEVDLAEALGRELGRPIEFKQHEFKNLVNDLKRGDIDLAMNGLEVTPDREKLVRFSRPYYIYRLQLVARKDAAFNSLAELKGKEVEVGTLSNTAAARLLDKMGIKSRTFDDQVNPYRDLAQGQMDAVLLDLPIAIYVVQKNEQLNSKLKFVGDPIEPGQYAIAFRPEDEALTKQFDEALGRLIKSGELQRIYEKWGLWNDDQKRLGSAETGKPLGLLPSALSR